jgi:branched-chain amino acid transport system ATP-binding protein
MLLQIAGVSKSFNGVRSLADVAIAVPDRGVVGLIGPNGAGKSTLINVLSGAYAPDSGSILFAGRDITNWGAAARARAGLVRTFQRPTPVMSLTVVEDVMTGGFIHGMSYSEARKAAEEGLRLLGMQDIVNASHRELPTSYLKLLDFARVLMLRPKLVLLDELMSGLSAKELETVLDGIGELSGRGIAFLVVEHLMDVIKKLSRTLIVMDAGKIIAQGEPQEVIRDPHVVEAYLGSEAKALADA